MSILPMNWDDLQYFLAVARTGQLSRAAQLLCTSHVTVGRRIDRLEQSVTARLFDRGPKGYTLTREGEQLRDIAEQIATTTSAIAGTLAGHSPEISGTIRLNMPEGFCHYFCSTLLPEFRRHFPALSLEVIAVQPTITLAPNPPDLTVMLDPPRSGHYYAEKITDYKLHVYGAESYLAAHPPLCDRDDMLAHNFIGYIDDMLYMPSLDYLAEVNPQLRATLQCSSIFSQIEAVQKGLGLAVMPDFLAARHPDLHPVLRNKVSLRRSYWFICRRDLRHTTREGAVIDKLLEMTRNFEASF